MELLLDKLEQKNVLPKADIDAIKNKRGKKK